MSRLFILGSGGPPPHPKNYGSSYVIQVGDEYLMFDCGPATTYKLVRMGLMPMQIEHLFFTHHHFDHDVDYPCFLLSRWDSGAGQEPELQVYGPAPTEEFTKRLLDEHVGAFAHDWKARINHPLSLEAYTMRGGKLPRRPPTVAAKDIGPGKVVQGKNWEVTSAPAEHVQPWLDSLAYRLDSDEGSVVVTGDTSPCQTVAELAQGADTLIYVCVGIQSVIDGGAMAKYMSGTTQAGKLAQEASAKRLILVHNRGIGSHGPMERAIADVAKVYDGEIIMGEEMLEMEL